jgi:tetratricopeptide (TPR) repeat protein
MKKKSEGRHWFPGAYNSRGNAYSDEGDYDRAIADCSRAITLNPNDAAAYNNRGAAYKDKGDCNRAIADYSQAIALNPDYAAAYFNRGIAYYNKKNYGRVAKHTQEEVYYDE